MTNLRDLHDGLQEQLLAAERALHYVKLCRNLVQTEVWKHIEETLEAEEKATYAQMLEVEASEAQFRELRAGIKCFRRLRLLPRISDKEFVERQSTVTRLQKQMKELQDMGLPGKGDPALDQLRAEVRELARQRL